MAPAELARAGCIVWVPRGGGQMEIVGDEPALMYDSEDDAVAKIVRTLEDPGRTGAAAYSRSPQASGSRPRTSWGRCARSSTSSGELTEPGSRISSSIGPEPRQAAVAQVDQLVAILHRRQPVRDRDHRPRAACDGARWLRSLRARSGCRAPRSLRRTPAPADRGTGPARWPRAAAARLTAARRSRQSPSRASAASLRRLRPAAPASPRAPAALHRSRRRECRTQCCGAANHRGDRHPARRNRSGAATRARGLRALAVDQHAAAGRRSRPSSTSTSVLLPAPVGPTMPIDCPRVDREGDVFEGQRPARPRSETRRPRTPASTAASAATCSKGRGRRHAQPPHVLVHAADPRVRLAHVADVQHDAVGRRHDAEPGVGEEREHRHGVAAGDVLRASPGTPRSAC